MDARALPILDIFDRTIQLQVPLFQRPYVWTREEQWEPLWEDIRRKFDEQLARRQNVTAHFLGALVLDQEQTWTTDINRHQIIDGQQRLTTIQIFLAALRDFCRINGEEDLANQFERFTRNDGILSNPDVDRFKVLPTQMDRQTFADVMDAGSLESLLERYPLKWLSRSKCEPRPPLVEAYQYFYQSLSEFFICGDEEHSVNSDQDLRRRIMACFVALKNTLRVVEIQLRDSDEPQVIFESLNAHGAPLLPADLLRNFVFLRASRERRALEPLYDQYWRPFDDEFWRIEERQGRLKRPRIDIFLQHFLASRTTADVMVKYLYSEYKKWIKDVTPYDNVIDELSDLGRNRDIYRRLLERPHGDVLSPIGTFLWAFDTSTAYPLLLSIVTSDLHSADLHRICGVLESYILRRAICGFTTKNYNHLFLSLIRYVQGEGLTPEKVEAFFLSQEYETSLWPDDHVFREAWMSGNAYQLSNLKLAYIFTQLDGTYRTGKNEDLIVPGVTVEHLLPQDWIEHWPLPGDLTGMQQYELYEADPGDPIANASRRRYELLNTFGNLTIITQSLNSAASNAEWTKKREEILSHSLLPINRALRNEDSWDEEAMIRRGEDLFARAVQLWPRPVSSGGEIATEASA